MNYSKFQFLTSKDSGSTYILDQSYRISDECGYDSNKAVTIANFYNKEVEKLVGEYVEIIPYSNKRTMRDGSIGKITEIVSKPFVAYSNRYSHYSTYYDASIIIRDMRVKVKFDDKHKEGIFHIGKFKFLPNYTGECLYLNKKLEKENIDIILKDRFDNDFTEGSFVCFAISTSRQQGIPLFGKITKIHSANYFKAMNMKLSDSDYESEYVLRSEKDVIVLNDELMSNIMLARLSF